MLLPEDLIILILLLDIDHPCRIGALRGVCGMFWRIMDFPEVLRRLPLQELRPRLVLEPILRSEPHYPKVSLSLIFFRVI